jgi:protein-tyrosine phosphatase
MVTVVPGLRIGSVANRHQARRVVAKGVNCVVDLRPDTFDPVTWPDGIIFTRIAMPRDRSPSTHELLEAAAFVGSLMRFGNELLLHCENGLERAPMVACAVLLLQGCSMTEAKERLAACRPNADLRLDQLTVLRDLQAAWFKSFDTGSPELTGKRAENPSRQAARS